MTTETITRVTPLGLRFFDDAAKAAVSEGLAITVTPPEGAPVQAQPTAGGAWIAHDIPGLREVEQGRGTPDWWLGETTLLRCRIAVRDARGRYLANNFDLDLPHRGAVVDPCVPGLGTTLGIPLFSSPGRPTPPGSAAIRAQLVDALTGGPASYAVLEVHHDTKLLGRGLADDRGRVAVFTPWPALAPPTPHAQNAITGQSWPLDLVARFEAGTPTGPRPDLCTLLGQRVAGLLDDPAPPHPPLLTPTLVFGRELVVRSGGKSTVFVLPQVP